MMIKINCNQQVRVRLTDVGRRIYRENAKRLNLNLSKEHQISHAPTLEEDGTYRDQLWSLMRDFGNHMGMESLPPFDMEIEIEE
jgi:hypothetical protein